MAYSNISNAGGSEGFTKTYWFYSNDTATPTTPIVHGAGSATTYLTNDNLGTRTFEYNPEANTNLWNPTTNKLDLTSLKIGDIVNFRVDIVIDHAAAQEINLVMDLAEGHADAYTLNVNHSYFKTANTNVTVTAHFKLPIISQSTVNNSARLRFTSIAAASIVVEGWYYEITEV
jgi:hypothetical protein